MSDDRHPDDDFFEEKPKNSIHDKSPEYEVGYRKPPVSGQIKPGEVRNANGRPKKKNRTLEEEIRDILKMKHTTRGTNGPQELTLREMILQQILVNAAKGDNSKLRMALPLLALADGVPEFTALPEDVAVMKKLITRLKEMEE